jgi:4-hydroxymandelate oxidase
MTGSYLDDLEARARELLSEVAYDYYAGGAGQEVTLRANQQAWQELTIRPRVLRDVSAVDVAVDVLETRLPHPILVAPMGFHRLGHPEGELATAAAAEETGSLMVVSSRSSTELEEITRAAPGAKLWFQVYVLRDRFWTLELIARAKDAGCSALVVTGDTPFVGEKTRPSQRDFEIPEDIYMVNRSRLEPAVENGDWQDPSVTFDIIGWLREESKLPVVVKGVLRGDDAQACVAAGASAVVVSNHGGRQLDGVIATARALAEVAQAVGESGEVYVDGGIRSGLDALRALALGARAVLVGRPVLWGLVTGGRPGVRGVLERMREELEAAAALAGAASISEITRDLIA